MKNQFSWITVFRTVGLSLLAQGAACGLMAQTASYQLQPIFTRQARTEEKVTLQTTFKYFDHAELQEADEFDGWELDGELVIPLVERWQVRLFSPLYIEGNARATDPGPSYRRSIDIHGKGGTFDFASASLEYEFMQGKTADDWTASAYAGYGHVFEPFQRMDTTAVRSGGNGHDKYNHQGDMVLFGLRADKQLCERWTLHSNLGGRYYFVSDDLHPDGGDEFAFMDASAAVVYAPPHSRFYPGLELVYQGDLSHYNSLLAVPQVTAVLCSHFELKAGPTVGLTGDGEEWGVRVQATGHF